MGTFLVLTFLFFFFFTTDARYTTLDALLENVTTTVYKYNYNSAEDKSIRLIVTVEYSLFNLILLGMVLCSWILKKIVLKLTRNAEEEERFNLQQQNYKLMQELVEQQAKIIDLQMKLGMLKMRYGSHRRILP
ncbi:uncharacterized protein LOC131942360 isoform X1 [Physella acuta]|uniref:uncharacterized protein LOC131942360 isoform X1 n=1 Tax=Physella acuta TaxID=109671 RepID=UPI0027DD74C1|nr:uncharacterized protein LOC131942360 isoform X1 [Physella acuta]